MAPVTCHLSRANSDGSDINPFIKHQKEPKSTATQLYLQLGPNSREHYSHYARGKLSPVTCHCTCARLTRADDIWIVSSNPSFAPRNADDVFFLARSVYHGPTSKGLLEVRMSRRVRARSLLARSSPWRRCRAWATNNSCTHCTDPTSRWTCRCSVGTALCCLTLTDDVAENLLLLRESTLPLIPALLGHFQPSPRLRVNLPPSRIAELAQDAINAHGLNDDQQR